MGEHWSGIVSAAAPEFVKGSLDKTLRKRLWMGLLNNRQLINTGVDGSYAREYNVDWREPPVTGFGHGGTATYAARDYLKRAKMDWRGYLITDSMHLMEYEMLKNSSHNLVNRWNRIIPKMTTKMQNHFGEEMYVDGSASGNELRFEGLETLCASGGTVVAADLIAEPDDTYHDLETDLNRSGNWTSALGTKPNAALGYDWPEGKGDSEFDYNSPMLVRTNSTSWGTGTADWATQAIPIVRRTAQWMRQSAGLEGDMLLLMIAGSMMTEFKALFDGRLNINVPHKEVQDLGFSDVLNFEGVQIQSEWGVPVSTGFMVAIDNMKLDFITDEMIVTKGPTFDDKSMSWDFGTYTFGNFTFSAKHVAKLYPFATT